MTRHEKQHLLGFDYFGKTKSQKLMFSLSLLQAINGAVAFAITAKLAQVDIELQITGIISAAFAGLLTAAFVLDAIRSRNILQLYFYIVISLLNLTIFALYVSNSFLKAKISEEEKHQTTALLISGAVEILMLIASIALIFPLKRQIGWDIYKIPGADESQIEMWRLYHQYLISQKLLVLIAAPKMLEFILPFYYDYSRSPAISITFHVANVIMFVWVFAMVPMGIYGARREKKSWFLVITVGLLLLLVANFVGDILVAKFVRSQEIKYDSYFDIAWSLVTLSSIYSCVKTFGKGLLIHHENNCTPLKRTDTVLRSRRKLTDEEFDAILMRQ